MNARFQHPPQVARPVIDTRHRVECDDRIAAANKVSPVEFYDAVFPGRAERVEASRAATKRTCMALIANGHRPYGFPPALVAECREELAA